jgi:hypothetical protein
MTTLVRGTDNAVKGNGNTLGKGTDNAVKGTDNAVKGTDNAVKGTDNTLGKGTDNAVKGTDNAVKGTDHAVKGTDNTLDFARGLSAGFHPPWPLQRTVVARSPRAASSAQQRPCGAAQARRHREAQRQPQLHFGRTQSTRRRAIPSGTASFASGG